ncbi:outer membrane protein assembly factor BamD [Phenylobacterium sp.]|uniref:outer membrane protein assembly factor BamD n=1 Tax=Phenylobacterium sp. TaxID=1871053 RepID=UPI0039C9992D
MLRNSWSRPALVAVFCALAVAGCSGNKKPKTKLAYEERPVELLYSTGADRMDKHLWGQAVDYFQEVERQHPYSEWSRRAILMQAFAHYQGNNYSEAIADADRFISLYPGNQASAYAHYLKAVCYFEQIVDVGRDQAATGQALDNLREVTTRYPHTEYALDARLKIDMVNDQLAGKEMTIGRWYLRQNDTLAAIGRFKTVVDRFQTTSHTPEALYRLVEAYLTLGLLDEAKKNGAVLGYNYPGDAWYVDAYELLTSKGLRPAVIPAVSTKRSLFHAPMTKDKAHTIAPPSGGGQTTASALSTAQSSATPAAQPQAESDTSDDPPKKKRSIFHIPFTKDKSEDTAGASKSN